MGDTTSRSKGKCAYCGKDIIVDSVRQTRLMYCSRPCASMSRYMKRYVGPRSEESNRPKFDKTKL